MVRKFGWEGDVTPVPEANKTKGLRDRLGRTLRACSRWEKTEGDDNHAGFPDQWHFSMLKSKQRGRKEGGKKTLCASLPNACVASQEFTSRWCHVHKQIMRTSYMLNKLVTACESERTNGRRSRTNRMPSQWRDTDTLFGIRAKPFWICANKVADQRKAKCL